ncbi:type II secretion system inner membrane protein GspF [Pseudomonas eucalypticola]|uniref:Type II secretion system inner membrane protein GspF n=1 Tax=Pseudomonas eucalypticola TaxID=2599595 RepID=A0A7D5D8N9_9PSED|nr:type II secretion system inner membrane protein GspF [Pseudomonas eucalypticola]QKZ05680.1 type II secretion system inner membrane protein GspF [Pseudomonas eucalypticola]
MAHFKYRALDNDGASQQGSIEAPDQQGAVALLQKRGLLVVQVDALGGPGLRRALNRGALNGAALVSFTQQLATLLGAGQPLERSLGILLKQTQAPKAHALIERIREQVKAGKPLSQALEEEGGQFSTLYISMVRAGEAGGALENTLRQLSDYLERSQTLRGEVINALIYPAFLIVGVLGSLALLLAYVVPQFVPIFRDLGVPIPLITQVILALGEFLSAWGLMVLAGFIVVVWGTAIALRDPARRQRNDRRLLRIKVIGPLLQRIEAARLARTLGTLLSNGVALLQALQIVRQVCSNRAVVAQVEHATEWVKGGGTLSSAFGQQPLLPELAIQMIDVGEQAGELDSMLLKVAEVFDVEAKRGIDRLLAALVPSLTVVMAVMVAVIMLAIMLPLMSLTSNI